MGTAIQNVDVVDPTDILEDVAGVSIEDVLAYMKENNLVKIVSTPVHNVYRMVRPLPDRNVYEKTLNQK